MAISVVEIQARWYKIKYIYEKVEKKILYLLKCNKETQEIWILTANFAVFKPSLKQKTIQFYYQKILLSKELLLLFK